MYHEFQENGNAAFCPDTSVVMLSEDNLLAASAAPGSDSSISRSHAEDDSARDEGPQAFQQPHAEQGDAHLESILHDSSALGQSDAATAAGRACANQEFKGSSSAEQFWPPDIQWLPVNPLVSCQSCIFWLNLTSHSLSRRTHPLQQAECTIRGLHHITCRSLCEGSLHIRGCVLNVYCCAAGGANRERGAYTQTWW